MLAAIAAWMALGPTERIVAGARGQLAVPARYDASYRQIAFPNGDVRWERGACSDVVVRAFRAAGYDLQSLVNEHRRLRGLPTDANIDHRRVKNQAAYFLAYGRSLTTSTRDPSVWRAGDVVYWILDSGQDHIGVVSYRRGRSGLPVVVHNIGTTKEEDVLDKWQIAGHYRFP
jgi:uncharacterized protein YijF (DUF1287 family)